jgi:hypothetical protein
MSIGTSGRIVIEVEPEVKRHLHSALAREGITLKEWFLRQAQTYLISANQLSLELSSENASSSLNEATR